MRIGGLCALALMLAAQGSANADVPQAQNARYDGFVYMLGAVQDSSGPAAIEGFGRLRSNGKLQHISRTLTGGNNNLEIGGAQQDALVSDGRHVFAVNPGSNTVSALSIRDGGQLSLIQQTSSGGLRPVSIAIHDDHLYVANAGHTPVEEPKPATVVGFRIREDGSLARLPCAPVTATPGEIGNIIANVAINPSGTVLLVTGLFSNKIDTFRIDRQGCLVKANTYPGGGGAFSVNFRPGTDDLTVTRALPELFPDDPSPGIGSYTVSHNGDLRKIDEVVDADKSDDGLRDPCWTVYARDGVHFWSSSFIPRAINAFSHDTNGRVKRLSKHQPEDDVADPSNPGGTVRVGSFDLAIDKDRSHIYQIRAFAVPDGQVIVPGAIHTFVPTGRWDVNAGLRELEPTPLPADFGNPCVTGLVFVDRP